MSSIESPSQVVKADHLPRLLFENASQPRFVIRRAALLRTACDNINHSLVVAPSVVPLPNGSSALVYRRLNSTEFELSERLYNKRNSTRPFYGSYVTVETYRGPSGAIGGGAEVCHAKAVAAFEGTEPRSFLHDGDLWLHAMYPSTGDKRNLQSRLYNMETRRLLVLVMPKGLPSGKNWAPFSYCDAERQVRKPRARI